jgi:hypothetical protein
VKATIAGKTVLPKRGPWKLSPVFRGVAVLRVLVVVEGSDDDEVSNELPTAGYVEVGR